MAAESSLGKRDWAVPPGEVLQEALEEREISQSELARRMDRPIKTINEIVNGKASITADTAIQLELALGITAGFWNGLQASYEEQAARLRAEQQLEGFTDWAQRFPVPDLVRVGLIERRATKAAKVAALLAYFGVSTPGAWEQQWMKPATSFRASPSFPSSPHAVAAWLRWGELLAEPIETRSFDAPLFREVLKQVRGMTRQEPITTTVDRCRKLCAGAGVVLVIAPEFKGTHLSGAARWLSRDRAIIQLSARHGSDDQLWFSFFHEGGHLLSGKRRDYVDAADVSSEGDEAEEEADRFARNWLIPERSYGDFVAAGDFKAQAVRKFAKEQGIAPGIVVGRLQRDEVLERSHLNELKKPIHWGKRV